MSILSTALNIFTGGGVSYIKIGIIIAIILAISGAVGYHYYTVSSLKDDIITITEEKNQALADMKVALDNAIQLEAAIATQTQYIARLQDQRAEDQEKLTTLAAEYAAARKETNKIQQTLSKHNLGNLSLRKPGLIERIINKGTRRIGKDLEALTTYEE